MGAEYVTFAWLTWEVTHDPLALLSLYLLCWNLLPIGGLLAGVLAAAVDARFAILFGGGVVAANALLLLCSARLRAIGQRPGLSAAI